MPIPDFQTLMRPLLQHLSDGADQRPPGFAGTAVPHGNSLLPVTDPDLNACVLANCSREVPALLFRKLVS